MFLAVGPASWFKGNDPSVSITRLQREWVSAARVLYVGSACDVRARIRLLVDFSAADRFRSVFHWDGRLLWQLAESDDLDVCWGTAEVR